MLPRVLKWFDFWSIAQAARDLENFKWADFWLIALTARDFTKIVALS